MDPASPARRSRPRGTYPLATLFFPVGIFTAVIVLPPVFYALGWSRDHGLARQEGIHWVLAAAVVALILICWGVVSMSRAHPVARGLLLAMCLLLVGAMLLAGDAADRPPTSSQKMARLIFALPPVAGAAWLLRPKYRRDCAAYRESLGGAARRTSNIER